MKSNYKRISELVERIDEKNADGSVDLLLGVSIEKCFIRSVANTIGTDLSKYKIIRKNDFAVSLMQVSRDSKIPIARLDEYDVAIMSPAYSIFRVKDISVVMPEYLEMWFQRNEFDREAAFLAVGGVRGSMPFDEFANIAVLVPPMEEQLEIVNSYRAITERIALKKRINDNLAATGISIISKKVGVSAQINKTMSEIEQIELPAGWSVLPIKKYCQEVKSGATPSRTNNAYWNNGQIPWLKSGEVHNGITINTEEFITDEGVNNSSAKLLPVDTVLMAMYGVTAGEVGYLAIPATTNQAVCGMICHSKQASAYLFFSLLQSQAEASRLSNGGAQDNLSKGFIEDILLVVPDKKVMSDLGLEKLIEAMTVNTQEISILTNLQSTILAQISSR